MKRFLLIMLALMLVFSIFVLTGCGGDNGSNVDPNEDDIVTLDPAEMPEEVEALVDKVTGFAAEYALLLNGEWADVYSELLDSSEGPDHPEFYNLKATLDQFRIESGAYFVYVLTNSGSNDDFFEMIIDSSNDSSSWLSQEKVEDHFLDAQEGMPSAASFARNNEENDPIWTAAAPIYNSDGDIVGIFVIDYPAPEILDFPEWNADS